MPRKVLIWPKIVLFSEVAQQLEGAYLMQRANYHHPAVVLTCAAIILLIAAGSGLAQQGPLNRDSIPDAYKWNLSDIYPDWETWEIGLANLDTMMNGYADLKGTLGQGPEQVLKAYKLGDELDMLAYRVYRYPGLTRQLDNRDNEVAGKLQQVQILFAKFGVATAWFTPELLTIPWETMETWLNDSRDLSPYRYSIENTYRQQEHVLDEEKETLLSYFSPFNGNAAAAFNELSTADIQYGKTVLSEGDSVTVTPGVYYNVLSTNRDQADRARAFETFYGVYHANRNTYAAIYNGILQRDWAQAQARNYATTLEASLDDDNVPVEVVENLIAAVNAGVGPLQRYIKLRKEALGLEEYHGYDGSIPIVDFDKTYEYDEVVDWVIESVEPLGKDYQEMMREAIDNRWIDVYETEGKTTGAFSAGVYGVHPYLLLNYNKTLNDVFTLAHELGHCMHTRLADLSQPKATADYTIFVAEVASTLNEALFLDYMLKRADGPLERIALLQRAIDNITGTFYAQVMFAEYELEAHRLVEQGQPITADVLTELYTRLWKHEQGDAAVFDELYGSTWTRIGHFYWAPYYVFKYATCFASSAQIVKGIVSDDTTVRQEALDRYLTLLKSGGNDYPMEQLKKAGVDLTNPEAFKAVIDQMDNMVTRLETELAKL